MAHNNKGLGRGIEALFDSGRTERQADDGPLQSIAITAISPSSAQPRKSFDENALDELAASIKKYGLLQPLLVRPGNADNTYTLIAGERRLRAAKRAGLTEVPAIVRSMTDQDALILTILENLQREDLNPIEEAQGLETLRQTLNVKLDELADTLGQRRSTISNSLRLLSLDPVIQADIAAGHLYPSHGRAIAGLGNSAAAITLRNRIIERGMTTREAEEAVARYNERGVFPWEDSGAGPAIIKKRKEADPNMLKLATDIGATLHCRTRISGNPDKGSISLSYDTNAQLYELLDKLGMSLHP